MSREETLRVFFALWPDAVSTSRLNAMAQQWHGRLGGRIMRQDTLHSTLVFIGNIGKELLPELLELPRGIQSPLFDIHFDAAGCWKHNHIAYLGVRQVLEPLKKLQFELATRVNAAGFDIEERAFMPHITLLRKVECTSFNGDDLLARPVSWTVRDFVLVKSVQSPQGSIYERIGLWKLNDAS